MASLLHNVFLDFLNRDSAEIYGLDRLPKEMHLEFLIEALTVAIFLCRDHCILPPGFLAESGPAREALLLRRPEYLHERLVRLPLREHSLDAFWEKKEHQYEPFREKYKGLFDSKNHRLLRNVSSAIIPRKSSIAEAIVTGWRNAPDANPVWRQRVRGLDGTATEQVREVVVNISNEGTAITWPAIEQRISEAVETSQFRPVLQNVYFSAYVREYDLKVVTNLPYTSHPFVVTGRGLGYDYEALKEALAAAGIWSIVRRLSAPGLAQLRRQGGYIRFRESFDTIASSAGGLAEIRKAFVLAAEENRPTPSCSSLVSKNAGPIIQPQGLALGDREIEEIAQRLGSLAAVALEMAHPTTSARKVVKEVKRTSGVAYSTKSKEVAIFVALEMERKILVERLGLEATGREQVWRGRLADVRISLFGRDEMGRVPAAIATMEFLSRDKPDLLLAVGIAGGFAREGVSLGNILIATDIVDLASRKLRMFEGTRKSEFRPREFRTDDRLPKYLRASFNYLDWQSRVVKDAEWPDDLRPAIRYGLVASLDEVVADASFVNELCEAWPKLLGIEMEAGGVCAAAETFKIRPAVIRGVSDLADPSKSDNEWRRRAMKTVAHLIESLDFEVLLAE